jgi:hypothetical protein
MHGERNPTLERVILQILADGPLVDDELDFAIEKAYQPSGLSMPFLDIEPTLMAMRRGQQIKAVSTGWEGEHRYSLRAGRPKKPKVHQPALFVPE